MGCSHLLVTEKAANRHVSGVSLSALGSRLLLVLLNPLHRQLVYIVEILESLVSCLRARSAGAA